METGRQRLAQYVIRDRSRKYPSRNAFASAAGLGLRTVDRIERAEVVDFRDRTKHRMQAALGWTDGSIDRILDGGRPGYVRDPLLTELVDLWPHLSRDGRRMLLRMARDAIGG